MRRLLAYTRSRRRSDNHRFLLICQLLVCDNKTTSYTRIKNFQHHYQYNDEFLFYSNIYLASGPKFLYMYIPILDALVARIGAECRTIRYKQSPYGCYFNYDITHSDTITIL